MCAGVIIQFGIDRVVVGESHNFSGARELLREHGVDVVDLDNPECRALLGGFITNIQISGTKTWGSRHRSSRADRERRPSRPGLGLSSV
jgi:hypothetical protein